MRPHTIPITDPRHHPRLRRASIAQILLVAATYLGILIAYRLAAPAPQRVFFVIVPMLLTQVIQWRTNRSFKLPKHAIPVLPTPHREIFAVCIALACTAPLISALCHPTFPPTAYSAIFGGPMIAAGLALLFCGLFASRPGPPACPNCRYPLTGLTLPTPCPECAHPLTNDNRAHRSAKRDIHLGTIQSGGILFCLGMMFIFLMLGATDTIYRALPGPLHRLLAASEVPALRTLDTTTLTPSQRETLASRILRERARREHPIEISDQIDWLAEEIAAGSLDPSFNDRYAFDGFTLRLIHDTPIRAGEPFRVSIAGTPPLYSPNGIDVGYFFAGFEIDHADPIARGKRDYPPETLRTTLEQRDREADRRRQISMSINEVPTHTLTITPPTPTPTHIRARIIVFVIPRPWTSAPTITWHDDGTYTITPTPLTTHELTAETTIEVTP